MYEFTLCVDHKFWVLLQHCPTSGFKCKERDPIGYGMVWVDHYLIYTNMNIMFHKGTQINQHIKKKRNKDKSKNVVRQSTFPKNHQQLFEPHAQWYPREILGLEDLMHKRLDTECG